MARKPKIKKFNLRLPKAMVELLRKDATALGVSINTLIRFKLRRGL